MSIIHDALKKAQEERKNKKQDIPYNPPGTEKKPAAFVYVLIGLCVVAVVFVYLYVSYFHRPQQIAQPVAATPTAPIKPVQVAVNSPSNSKEQKPAFSEKARPVFPQKKAVKEKNIDTSRILAQKQSRDKERAPSLPATAKKDGSDVQEIAGKPGTVVIRQTGDYSGNGMYNEALKALQAGRTKEAKNIYKQIIAMKPNHLETLNNLGVIAMEEDNRIEALFYFKRILEYQKNYPKAYNNIGLIAMKDGDGKLAEEYFRKAISIEPDGVEPYLNLAALLRSRGRFQEAAKLLDIPIGKKIKDPSLALSYAVVKDNLGEYEEAARYYRQYLSLLPAPGSRKDIIERLRYVEEKR
jgi:tetratricopeptide (TPR) repeat protein